MILPTNLDDSPLYQSGGDDFIILVKCFIVNINQTETRPEFSTPI